MSLTVASTCYYCGATMTYAESPLWRYQCVCEGRTWRGVKCDVVKITFKPRTQAVQDVDRCDDAEVEIRV